LKIENITPKTPGQQTRKHHKLQNLQTQDRLHLNQHKTTTKTSNNASHSPKLKLRITDEKFIDEEMPGDENNIVTIL